MSITNKLRLSHGLHWSHTNPACLITRDLPGRQKTYLIRLLLILGIWGWAMDRDYRDQVAEASHVATQQEEIAYAQLAACLNGTLRLQQETKKGQEVRYTICRPAEEINVGRFE